MKKVSLVLLYMLGLHVAIAQTYVVHANLVDVETQRVRPDYTVVLSADSIVAVGPAKKIKPKAGARIIDATGKWVMPGLVDAHVHFFQTGGLYTRPDAIDLRHDYPYEKEIAWYKANMEAQLRRYLSCGITTVIDEGATLDLLRQRDSFANKIYAPQIYMAGPLVSTRYTPKPFDQLTDPDQPFYPVNSAEEAAAMTEKQYPFHPDFIKIWYIVTDDDKTRGATENLPLVEAVIETAHRHNYRVAVHATEKATAERAVAAGADFLVHEIDDEPVDQAFLDSLKSHGTVLCPTLTVESGYFSTFAQRYNPSPEDIRLGDPLQLASLQELAFRTDSALGQEYKAMAAARAGRSARADSLSAANLKKMADAGVTIATGTDAGNIGTLHASSYFAELRAMKAAGLSNWQILVASTLNGARAVGMAGKFGSISQGKRPDLLLLSANPVDDLANLEKIEGIYHRDSLFVPDSVRKSSPADIVQQQVNAYNAHDIARFLTFYADTATLYDARGNVETKGKEAIRKTYAFLSRVPSLHVTIENRIVMNNKVTDHELVSINRKRVGEGMAIYFVDGGKISKVIFLEDTDR